MMTSDARSGNPFKGNAGQAFPKRFYQTVTIAPEGDGFGLLLDGRLAHTPSRSPLVVPVRALAQVVAEEWTAVEATIDPRTMPMTRLVNSVIDGVTRTQDAVVDEVLGYASSDLVVYRATEPPDLVRAQQDAWDPIVAWSRDTLGSGLTLAEGVMFLPQPPDALARLAEAVRHLVGQGPTVPFRLGALHVMTTLSGSALLGMAVAAGRLAPEAAWAAAHVDEDFQISQWGEDSEATERRAHRWVDMRTAASLDRLTRTGGS